MITVPKNAPYSQQWLGAWAMDPQHCEALARLVAQTDIAAHLALMGSRSTPDVVTYRTEAGVGVVELRGTLMKTASSLGDSTSTVAARRALREFADDKSLRSILLHIESPGGTVSGTQELADDVRAATRQKKVTAYIEDLGASAAYWIASQATHVYANAPATIGSIGTFAVVRDSSAMADKLGITVHVVKAGEFKGAGTPGTRITDSQLAEFQRLVDAKNELFLAAIQRGRNMSASAVRAVADGRAFIASEAQRLGLIDGVKSFDDVLGTMSPTKRKPEFASFRDAVDATLAKLLETNPRATRQQAATLAHKQFPELVAKELAAANPR